MQVVFDAQTFMRQRTGGISRLFTDLVREFDGDSSLGVEATLPFRLSNNRHAADGLADRGLSATPAWLPRGVLYAPWWFRGARPASGYDIVHHTYYSGRFLRVEPRSAHVTTVYDMIPELFAGSDHFTATHLQKRHYVEACDLVICISESTRSDMVSVYGDVAANVHVIPLAVQPGFGPHHDPLPGLPGDYVLYVGARDGYKDFGLLPEALEALAREGLVLPLVVVGKPLSTRETADLSQRGLLESTHVRQLDDADLKRAYAHCSLLVQTSRYEGFGLTPLEGMASGIPVIVARASSMPEVCGEVAQYFTPGDPEDLASVMAATLNDEGLRSDLAVSGPLRAAGFSTYEMARKTASAYKSVATG